MDHHVIDPILRPLSKWAHGFAEHSQRQACRNAMVASTAIAAGRQEREEVQLFVETMLARRARVDVVPRAPAAHFG
jgi:hypothetical protein